MKKILNYTKLSVVAVIMMAAMLLLFAESDSVLILVSTKVIAGALIYASRKLFDLWSDSMPKFEEL